MGYLRLVKYPGAKNEIIPEIGRIFKDSGAELFVDVFGGSGTVSLNVSAGSTVYNDISLDTCNLFRILKINGRSFSDALKGFLLIVREESISNDPQRLNRIVRERGEQILVDFLKTQNWEDSVTPSDIDTFRHSLLTFFRLGTSFGGMGDTYGTPREKSPFRSLEKAVSTVDVISKRINGWRIENLDFRDLVKKYDAKTTFFYLDPPYPGKDWYGSNFSRRDFEDIKKIMESISGKYLLTLDSRDEWLEDLFGKSQYVHAYFNRNAEQDGKTPKRRILFYTNV